MLSKEEIKSHIDLVKLPQYEADSTERALVEYIEQLESDNYELNNIINDYIEEIRYDFADGEKNPNVAEVVQLMANVYTYVK